MINNRETRIGDIIIDIWENSKPIKVITIEHNTHGIKYNPEDYCNINGYYYNYKEFTILKRFHLEGDNANPSN